MQQVKEHHEISVSSERSFGYVFAALFAIIALWPLMFGDAPLRLWALLISAGFLAISLLKPDLLKPLNKLWFAFGLLLGKVVAPIVMMVVYAITVVPTGYVMRLRGKNLLSLQTPSPEQKTFWILRDKSARSSMKNQF